MIKKISVIVVCLVTGFAASAGAYTIDDPGDANVVMDSSPWLEFANTEWLSGSPTGFEVYVDTDGSTYFDSSSMQFVSTSQTYDTFTIEAQMEITDVSGMIIANGDGTYQTVDWTITADMRFRAGTAFNSSTCKTGSFTIDIIGYVGTGSGSTSSVFTIPALSGTGTGACSSHASTVNSDFSLGTSGAYFQFYKDEVLDSSNVLVHGHI